MLISASVIPPQKKRKIEDFTSIIIDEICIWLSSKKWLPIKTITSIELLNAWELD